MQSAISLLNKSSSYLLAFSLWSYRQTGCDGWNTPFEQVPTSLSMMVEFSGHKNTTESPSTNRGE